MPLSDEQMKQLVTERKTDLIKGFKKKSGTGTFDARLFINEEFKVRFEFENRPRGPEPESGSGAESSGASSVSASAAAATAGSAQQ